MDSPAIPRVSDYACGFKSTARGARPVNRPIFGVHRFRVANGRGEFFRHKPEGIRGHGVSSSRGRVPLTLRVKQTPAKGHKDAPRRKVSRRSVNFVRHGGSPCGPKGTAAGELPTARRGVYFRAPDWQISRATSHAVEIA
jgi:hypothetical protein